ncbi:hypothetical protein RI569_08410 [Streptococcus pneumoniae]|nr:hypothetical protein [Streptococcus pneumoniae]
MKDSLLFAEGFIGAAGNMVSETAIGAVDLTQIIVLPVLMASIA